jgi:hypothetical protein
MKKKSILVFIFIFTLPVFIFCQTNKKIMFSIGNEKLGLINYSSFINSFNPNLDFSYTIKEKSKKNFNFYHNVKTSFIYHKQLQTSFCAGYEGVMSFEKFFIIPKIQYGIGYLLNYSLLNNYSQDFLIKKTNFENRFYVDLALVLAFRIKSSEIFIKNSILIQMPYLKNNSFVLPHQIINIGFKF